MKEKFNYEELEKGSIERLKQGESLLGKEGILTPLLKQFLEKALEGEIAHHLDEAERKTGNRRNGKRGKQVKTSSGQFELEKNLWKNRSSDFFKFFACPFAKPL